MQKAKSLPMKAPLHNVYVTPDGRFVVAGSVRGKFAVVVDVETEQVAWKVAFDEGVRPMAFDVNPDGSTRNMFVQLSNVQGSPWWISRPTRRQPGATISTNLTDLVRTRDASARLPMAPASRQTARGCESIACLQIPSFVYSLPDIN